MCCIPAPGDRSDFPGFPRLSCINDMQKWAMGPFQESEEEMQVTRPCFTGGGDFQKSTESSTSPHISAFVKSHIAKLHCFLVSLLTFHFVSQLDCDSLKCRDCVTLFCFLHSAQHQGTGERTLYWKPDSSRWKAASLSALSWLTLGKLDSLSLSFLSLNGK